MTNQNQHDVEENNANNTQPIKKQSKLRGFFGLSKSKTDVKVENVVSSSHTTTLSTKQSASVVVSKEDKPLPPPPPTETRFTTIIFSQNVSKPTIRTKLPCLSERVESIDQLVYCNTLLLQSTSTIAFDKQELQERTNGGRNHQEHHQGFD
ncbi:hypothetical protein EC991_006023 [Linnemannia zychae]|nr:hypothetical protein EC991_006023 [Linnemannia zychae]